MVYKSTLTLSTLAVKLPCIALIMERSEAGTQL